MKRTISTLLAVLMLLCSLPLTASAAEITVNGAAAKGSYTVSSPVVFEINKDFSTFNEYSLTYSCDVPCEGNINFGARSEQFFLAAGENVTFTSLIDAFPQGGKNSGIRSITISCLNGIKAEFELISVSTATRDVPSNTVYIESDRYKLGVDLLWGGGISYIEDLKDGRKDLKNLLNNNDTGRLVQQSYYGTNQPPYECGRYMNANWSYNPVQGGNLYNEASKIIDYKISDGQIWIKSRARDWAKHDYTYTYYENTYTLDGDLIRVNNMMTDYSPYSHPITTQEIPAFYVISYLDRFVYYNGNSPWTGDEVSIAEDLGFWGEHKGIAVTIEEGNTETWCAWVDDHDYGIGLYTPGTKNYTAGRYEYNGTKTSKAGPTNYVAPVTTTRIAFGIPLTYDYLICAGTVDEIRGEFTENKEFTDNKTLYPGSSVNDFSVLYLNSDHAGQLLNGAYESTFTMTPYKTVMTGVVKDVNDPYISLDLNASELTADEYKHMVFVYSIPTDNAHNAYMTELFLGAGSCTNAEAGKSVFFQTMADDKVNTQVIDLSNKAFWTGKMNFIRIDFFSSCQTGDIMNVYAIAFAKTRDEAVSLAESLRKEMQNKEDGITEDTQPETEQTEAPPAQTENTDETQTSVDTLTTEPAATGTTAPDDVTTGGAPQDGGKNNTALYVVICVLAAAAVAVTAVIVIKKRK